MTDAQALSIALSLVAALFAVLSGVIGWLGAKIYEQLVNLGETMRRIEGDLHSRISKLDQRVTAVEVRCKVKHEDGME